MPEMTRATMTRLVYKRLASDAEFRRRLSAQAPDGSHPIVVSLRDDPVSDLITRTNAAGGAANVIVPTLNGILAFAMERTKDKARVKRAPALKAECTVGVLVERLRVDGGKGVTYRFVVDGPGESTEAQAQLVAVTS